jgi:hypothetical protein
MTEARLGEVVAELVRYRRAEIEGAGAPPEPYRRLAQRLHRTLSPQVAAAAERAPEEHCEILTLGLARLLERDPATRDLVRALAQGNAGEPAPAAARDLVPALTQAFARPGGAPPAAAVPPVAGPAAASPAQGASATALPAGAPTDASGGALAAAAPVTMFNQGSGVQVGGNFVMGSGNAVGSGNTAPVSPVPIPDAPTKAAAAGLITILFVGANPVDGARLRLDEEVREIDAALRQGSLRDRFDLKQHWAVRMLDLQQALLLHRPQILHFSGHGSPTRAIYLEGEGAQSQAVSGQLLARLLALFSRHLRCVVLNACYSEEQAKAVAEHVECVVGMTTAVGDRAAISFAAAFYQALAYGADVQTAFELGCVHVQPASPGEENTPKLIALRRKPSEILFSSG